jgi:hypothetical protein
MKFAGGQRVQPDFVFANGGWLQNEKATRQQGSLFFQGRIVPTEVESIRTFCANLMGRKSTVSSKIYDLNSPIFNDLHKMSTTRQTRPKWSEKPHIRR